MSNELNKMTNVNSYGNTGIQQLSFDCAEIIAAMFVPKEWVADSTYMGVGGASLKANLQADCRKAIGSRIFPIASFGGIDNKSVEAKFQTYAYGAERLATDGKYGFEFPLMEGALSLHKNIRKFKAADYNIVYITSDGYMIATNNGDKTKFYGLNSDSIYCPPWMPADGSNASIIKLRINHGLSATKQFNEDRAYIKLDFDFVSEIVGLIDVELTSLATATTSKLTVGVTTNEKSVDFFDLYGADFAKVACFVVKDQYGALITVSGVTLSATLKAFELASSAAFPTGTNVTVQIAAPSVLAAQSPAIAATGNGLESNVLTIAVP